MQGGQNSIKIGKWQNYDGELRILRTTTGSQKNVLMFPFKTPYLIYFTVVGDLFSPKRKLVVLIRDYFQQHYNNIITITY